jgi:hypothetical protein
MAAGFTVGRHAADDEAGVHPLVAAALEVRHAPEPGVHRSDRPVAVGSTPDGEGGLGWPGTPGDGSGGLGWPGDTDTDAASAPRPPAPRRSVWRRLFGGTVEPRVPVASANRGSSAA